MRTAHALSSLRQAHRIITTMIMSRIMIITSMHLIIDMITVTTTIITMAIIRRIFIMTDKTIVIVNPIVTWFDLVGCRSTRHFKTGLL
jgi:hypothetical protein